MAYSVEVSPAAERQLKKLPAILQARIVRRLRHLGENPRPPGAKKLAEAESLWRVRVGDHRVVYELRDKERIIVVLKIAHRSEVYRRR